MLSRLVALAPDAETKKVDADKVKAFNDANPETLLQGKYFASQAGACQLREDQLLGACMPSALLTLPARSSSANGCSNPSAARRD